MLYDIIMVKRSSEQCLYNNKAQIVNYVFNLNSFHGLWGRRYILHEIILIFPSAFIPYVMYTPQPYFFSIFYYTPFSQRFFFLFVHVYILINSGNMS